MCTLIGLGNAYSSSEAQLDVITPGLQHKAGKTLILLLIMSQMNEEGRYHEMLFISDTCQAASLYGSIQAPHIVSMASSKIGKNLHHSSTDAVCGCKQFCVRQNCLTSVALLNLPNLCNFLDSGVHHC